MCLRYNTQHSSLLWLEQGLLGKVQDTNMGGLGRSSVVRIHHPNPGGKKKKIERKR
ncbi:Uncharacterized protein DAT39_008582, partial [Clarias magur]